VTIPEFEAFDEEANEFVSCKQQDLCLEHSLVSISKWESKWKKPFISKEQKTTEQTIDYVRCMTITKNVDPNCYLGIPMSVLKEINSYIDDSMTATWFTEHKGRPSREVITSELIYYWMVAYNIPFECQKWHLNRLLTLIRICSIKNNPSKKKMSKSEIMARNKQLNAARRAKSHSRG
jgi:hypothetical protein